MQPKPPQFEPIDLNVLPEIYRPRVPSPVFTLIRVLSISLAVLLVPGYVVLRNAQARTKDLATELTQAQQTLRTIRTPDPTIVQLSDELSRTLRALEVMQVVSPTISAGRKDWARIFDPVLAYDGARIQLTELFQDKMDVSLKGYALSREDVQSYVTSLDRSGVFQQVIIQSMQDAVLPRPTGQATPGLTGTIAVLTPLPGLATPTPRRSPVDAYEIDDFEPTGISVGQVQWHSFNPVYDMDRVTFLGKAGRRYCIQALPQSLGVDTYLEVTVGGQAYTNDDCRPNVTVLIGCQCPSTTVTGSMASLVEIQVSSSGDQMVQIKVSNRGQYGPDKWYTILVGEGLADPFEYDDVAPKPISAGEAQSRSFFPAGDVDRVVFSTKAGHVYEVRTANLALGVDTALMLQANGIEYQNDDSTLGDPSSRIEFQAVADGSAIAIVTNKGQFGPDMTYRLQLLEVGGDAYEPDDVMPRPLSLWESQRHTFYPERDVDRVEFLVKTGRVYEVKTYSLTIGVDSVLSVIVGGLTYQNDDVSPRDHSSRVLFVAPVDGKALVTVSNREQYAPNKEYWITASELAGLPTPDVTAAPTVPVPTATTFCGDSYEPDNSVARLIVVGESQRHNLCPSGDLDRAVFTAKSGYAYVVETSDLALGVDTIVSVQIGGTVLTSDDRSPQDLSSRVQIQNLTGRDSPAFVAVSNKGVFGQDKAYTLKVSDVGAGDAFELDDANPLPIAIGSAQRRTFYPPGDVDRVYFLAKAGHRYRISTTNLAPYVDTVLQVNMGSAHPANDDCVPGGLSSCVELQNYGPGDSRAEALVTNRGQYGPDKSYDLQVEDMCVDVYEPDLGTKRYISVGETQRHSFCPDLDVDQLTLLTKAGRAYMVVTCGGMFTGTAGGDLSACYALTPGVDSLVVVAGPILSCDPPSCQNDDAQPGTGKLNSRVTFSATTDGEVTITIYNKGLFGPNLEYYVNAAEVGVAPVPPTPTRTATPTKTPTPVPPPTGTPAPYPTSSARRQGDPEEWLVARAGDAGRVRMGLAAPLSQAPTRQVPFAAKPGDRIVQFSLLLRLKSVAR